MSVYFSADRMSQMDPNSPGAQFIQRAFIQAKQEQQKKGKKALDELANVVSKAVLDEHPDLKKEGNEEEWANRVTQLVFTHVIFNESLVAKVQSITQGNMGASAVQGSTSQFIEEVVAKVKTRFKQG